MKIKPGFSSMSLCAASILVVGLGSEPQNGVPQNLCCSSAPLLSMSPGRGLRGDRPVLVWAWGQMALPSPPFGTVLVDLGAMWPPVSHPVRQAGRDAQHRFSTPGHPACHPGCARGTHTPGWGCSLGWGRRTRAGFEGHPGPGMLRV